MPFQETFKNITVKQTYFKTFGVWLSIHSSTSVELNYTEMIKNSGARYVEFKKPFLERKNNNTEISSRRHIVAFIQQQHTPVNILENISKLLFNFLWNKKTLE